MTITRSGMTPAAIEEIIAQRVTEALAAQEANRATRLEAENQSQNRDDGNNNGNGNGGRNENNRNGNPSGCARRDTPVARVCTYKDFLNCQPHNFSGTEGVIGLARWFQELTLLCPRMVPEEDDKIKRHIWSLPDNVQGNMTSSKPVRLQDVIRMASSLMDQKVRTYAARSAENKIKLDNHLRDNRAQPPPFKRQSMGGQNVARAYMVGSNKKRRYARSLPYCNKCTLHYEGQCTVKCNNCKKVGHMARDCKAAVATPALRAPVLN
ncbi:putative reverse transcriptase domain-containing protein [Tanacetum coccineum]